MMRLVLICLGCLPLLAHGATYKCVDAQGRVSYSQMPEPGKRCTEASLPPVQTIPSQAPTPQPESAIERGAPAESKGEQSKAGAQDLVEAKKALDDARKRLAEQEAVRYGDEKNYQRVLDRLKPYQDEVSRAEARVRELGGTP